MIFTIDARYNVVFVFPEWFGDHVIVRLRTSAEKFKDHTKLAQNFWAVVQDTPALEKLFRSHSADIDQVFDAMWRETDLNCGIFWEL